ncbi:MAG: hypothetical protein C0518_12970 [Opitutus sp.]|nr:hypothetical protein [Opitutus sp.]
MNSRVWFLLLAAALALAAAARVVGADRTVQFDAAHSTVEIVVQATVDSFTGKLSTYELSGTVDEQGRFTAARLAFRFRDVLTGKPKRDQKMHEWQRTAQFPDASFVLTALTPVAGGDTRARGTLTLHGVAREMDFPVTIAREANTYAIEGVAPVDVREFGLPVIRMMGLLKVDPIVRVRFHFQGKVS